MQTNDGKMSVGAQVAMSVVIGGTAEKLGGGKFANGAVTGAFVMMFNHLGQQGNKKQVDPVWEKFERLDFRTLNDGERTKHILDAIRFANDNGGIDVDLDIIFSNFKPNTSGAFKRGLLKLTIDDVIMPFQLEIGIYSRLNSRFNTVFNFSGGQVVNRTINNSSWTFFTNPGFHWGTTAKTFDLLYNNLKY